METMNVGEKLKNLLTGRIYEVKLIGDRMVVLEAEDRLSQILASVGALNTNYERMERLQR
jgi:hypothetical protein